MIEQVFIQIHRNGAAFSSHYLGVRDIDDCILKSATTDGARLPDYESLLTEHGFTLADNNEKLRIRVWTRRSDQLALAEGSDNHEQ